MPDPQKINKYTVIERIGRGGMGYVYRAHDPILKRDVALKTMLRDVSDDPELRNRFMREAQSAGGLRHPNIVTIYDLGEDESGCPYIAMEFLTGIDLEHLIKNKTSIPLLKKLDIIIQTCQGLGFAHANGIVHRDIKTANIRLLDNGEVKIMDFGIAKMTASHFTRTGMIMGTPHYMAPEQIRGEKVDGRADIFSLAVVLYELLVYRKPFPGETPTTVLFKIIHEEPDRLADDSFTPPEGLEEIVLRGMAKKVDDRYPNCEEFADDLRYIFNTVQQQQLESGEIVNPTPTSQSMGRFGYTPPPIRRTGSGTNPAVSAQTPFPKTKISTTPPPPSRMEPTEMLRPPSPEGATVLTPQSEEASETSYAPETSYEHPDLPPISPTPIPSPSKIWWIVASSGILGIGLLVVVLLGAIKKTDKPPEIVPNQPSTIVNPSTTNPRIPAETSKGFVSLNIQPWAEIKDIKNDKGEFVTPPFASTPCKIQLPTGKYRITLSNPQFETKIVEIEVKKNETSVVHETLKGFDDAKAIESLGL
jgi:serine/threonine-protein kinase